VQLGSELQAILAGRALTACLWRGSEYVPVTSHAAYQAAEWSLRSDVDGRPVVRPRATFIAPGNQFWMSVGRVAESLNPVGLSAR